MGKKLGTLLILFLSGALLVYSASRSFDFISLTLPADKQILAYFALFALDGGLVAWIFAFKAEGTGGWQKSIAAIMIIIDFLGACAMFTMDTVFNTGRVGLTTQLSEGTIFIAIIALSLIISANIGMAIAYHLTDPETLRKQAENDSKSEIEDEALKLIKLNSKSLASKLAPQIASAWSQQIETEYGHKINRRASKLPGLPAQFDDLPAQTSDLPAIESNPTPPPSRKR